MTRRTSILSNGVRRLTGGLSARLYFFAVLSLLAVGSLALAAIYFARTTETASRHLYADGFVGVLNSTRLELLLEHHRRIVESMPSELNRKVIQSEKEELEQIRLRLLALIDEIIRNKTALDNDNLEQRIADSLPPLFENGDKVTFYSAEFAQDRALEYTEAYGDSANKAQALTRTYRDLRLTEARDAIELVSKTAQSLIIWVLVSALLAIILIGPIGLSITRRALSRLERITAATVKLANDDTTTDIPSRNDADEVGEIARAVEIFKNNAIALIAREKELKALNRRIDVALNNMTHGLCMFDADQKLIVCNNTYAQMYDFPPELTASGTSLQAMENHRVRVGNCAISSPEQAAAGVAIRTSSEPSALTHELMDGRIIAVSQRPMADGGLVAVHEDITERKRAEAKISHLARHDMLTNLPNRVLFREHVEDAFKHLAPGRGFAIHCLDLDHFKTVNDTLGHPIGDDLLKAVASRLLDAASPNDIIARIGGDEFAVVQLSVHSPRQCSDLASRIIESVSQPYDIDGRHIVIGASIGIALAPNDGANPDQLLKNSDMALYLAKGDGRGTHRFFEADMDRRIQARRSLELDLRKAIAQGEFEMHYQPIICLTSGTVRGFEALIRWNHPERGQVLPDEFIAVAEETGLIVPLGEWILRTACSHAVKWPSSIGVAVNLSATQFKMRNLAQLVLSALASTGLQANRLDLEITESSLLQDEAATFAILTQLRELGVRISLDDFGTGYSSLSYLRNFPFDKIKIDKSFVNEMLTRKDCQAIVQAVVGLANSLGIITVIEGVETNEQRIAATADGCTQGQGYLFGRPMPEHEVLKFLAKPGMVARAA